MSNKTTSPIASGPAGSNFESRVAASYLLCMLAEAEPFGLPGTKIASVEFQRASDGFPLDDIIIHARDADGRKATLEIQAKRSITFAPSDPVFKKAAGQIAQTLQEPNFWNENRHLAVASAVITSKISGPYQDLLRWARTTDDPVHFHNKLICAGHFDMRTLVGTLQSHLSENKISVDDGLLLRLLSKFHILSFDFTAADSTSEQWNLERARNIVSGATPGEAQALWNALINVAGCYAAEGGDLSRDRLIGELKHSSIDLAGTRKSLEARKAIREISRHTLDDIGDTIGRTHLIRNAPIANVRDALDAGHRFIEIRGEGGVGKSAVLKHFAEIAALDSTVIVLGPERTVPGGWAALRGQLGFDGTASELFSDLACDGGAFLFIDGLDTFDTGKHVTIIDLVREAAKVSNFKVICTARADFGYDGTNWLSQDAKNALNPAVPIIIEALTEGEADELRSTDLKLAHLLSPHHPAKDLTENLFRLSHLLSTADAENIYTEADMLDVWWKTADAKFSHDPNRRARQRVLRSVAMQAIDSPGPFDTTKENADALNELIGSGALRDHGNDKVTFRHEVLREWAAASLLISNLIEHNHLPLSERASIAQARAVELAARHLLERTPDEWPAFLSALSGGGAHQSWRRAALLALVRSEKAPDCLDQVINFLVKDKAAILRELIRTVRAVEMQSAAEVLGQIGENSAEIQEGITIPNAASYSRLAVWAVRKHNHIPPAAIPEITDLLSGVLIFSERHKEFGQAVIQLFFKWLQEIETAKGDSFQNRRQPFSGQIQDHQVQNLENKLRPWFLAGCHLDPESGLAYAQSLLARHSMDSAIQDVVLMSGSLAQVAPKELAELTARALIHTSEDHVGGGGPHNPFTYFDTKFMSAAPDRGPFYKLLVHAPEHGLSLVRRLVEHAVIVQFSERPSESDAFVIKSPDGERVFPWQETYRWSRNPAGHSAMACALMALEYWAHKRMEAGEDFNSVLSDVIGEKPPSAAYVLVAVDLIISHWPKSCQAAIPFLSCLELLCTEHTRPAHDRLNPVGMANTEASIYLQNKPSRAMPFELLLFHCAFLETGSEKKSLIARLSEASEIIGLPSSRATFNDPAFMAQHALNRLGRENYIEDSFTDGNGEQKKAWRYESPPEEAAHLKNLQAAAEPHITANRMPLEITSALRNESESSPQFIKTAVEWVKNVVHLDTAQQASITGQTTPTAAFLMVRDGDDDLFSEHKNWAQDMFVKILHAPPSDPFQSSQKFVYNPPAIAFAGLIYMLKRQFDKRIVRVLLEAAGNREYGAVSGFAAAAPLLADIDDRLLRAVIRCGFASSRYFWFDWDVPEEDRDSINLSLQSNMQDVINAEMAWLYEDKREPKWPEFVSHQPKRRHGILIPSGQPRPIQQDEDEPSSIVEKSDYQRAADWLNALNKLAHARRISWLPEVCEKYATWTISANGGDFDQGVSINNAPSEWNSAYSSSLASALLHAPSNFTDDIALPTLTKLSDQVFFSAVSIFLPRADALYIDTKGLSETSMLKIRKFLAEHLFQTWAWRRFQESDEASVQTDLSPVIAAFFFIVGPPYTGMQCLFNEENIDRLPPFLPLIEKMITSAPHYFTALAVLKLFETSPKAEHFSALAAGAKAWISRFSDNSEFWIGYNIGRTFCRIIEAVIEDPAFDDTWAPNMRTEIDHILAELVRFGVHEASQLEVKLDAPD